MTKRWTIFLMLAFLGGAPEQFGAPERDPVWLPRPMTAEYLAHIRNIPFSFELDPVCPEYRAIVDLGLPVVPELIDLLDTPTDTGHLVPLTGGTYAVGDVAMTAISDIIRDVPWLSFITRADDPKIDEIGFGVYWNYVRASVVNRQALKKRAKAWYDQNRSRLVWQSIPNIPSGGVYVLPGKTK
jgi:hypothetical protein